MNEAAKNVIEKLGIKLDYYTSPDYIAKLSYSMDKVYIIVDTSNSIQLGVFKKFIEVDKTIVIDHHRPGDLSSAKHALIDPSYPSSSELVYDIIKPIHNITPLEATILLIGILYDTRRFIWYERSTFRRVHELIEARGDYTKALEALKKEISLPERIARLKAAQRMKLYRCGDYIIVVSHVGAYEGSAARSLIELGADIAVVYSTNKERIRITARASPQFVSRSGVSIGRDLMAIIADLIKGSGGGHDTAGTSEGTYIPRNIEDKLYRIICQLIIDKN